MNLNVRKVVPEALKECLALKILSEPGTRLNGLSEYLLNTSHQK
jgi:hypothetical protein